MRGILRRHPHASIVALERDHHPAHHIHAEHRDVLTVHGDAAEAVEGLGHRGDHSASAFVSSLPCSLVGEREQRRVPSDAHALLLPDGAPMRVFVFAACGRQPAAVPASIAPKSIRSYVHTNRPHCRAGVNHTARLANIDHGSARTFRPNPGSPATTLIASAGAFIGDPRYFASPKTGAR